jgi:hypothetical protein
VDDLRAADLRAGFAPVLALGADGVLTGGIFEGISCFLLVATRNGYGFGVAFALLPRWQGTNVEHLFVTRPRDFVTAESYHGLKLPQAGLVSRTYFVTTGTCVRVASLGESGDGQRAG